MARRLTAEEFIEKAREVHGDAYSYDLSTFSGTKRKMRITCPEHGDFWQTPGSHIHQGNGCPRHRGGDFYARAAEVHGDRYTYGEYVNSTTKVEIICPEHGAFYQLPHSHLGGAGCARCRGNGRLTTEEFIERAREKHGDTYDYSRSKYTTSKKKVTIGCREHGEFSQVAREHLRGSGCPRCVGKGKTSRDVVEEFREVHGERYDYSQVEYRGALTPVTIICPEHGEFSQTPNSHSGGSGCPECAGTSRYMTTTLFIEKAKAIHGDRYDYSKTVYVDTHTPVTIIDPYLGEFTQKPANHLQGHGPAVNKRLTTEEFIKRAREVHGNYFDYSKVIYRDMHTLVSIIDPNKGEFEITPNHHLLGIGYTEGLLRGRIGRVTEEIFLERSNEVHSGLYDYSKVDFVDSTTKVLILDPEYGDEFWQSPVAHMRGQGNPRRVHQTSLPHRKLLEWLNGLGINYLSNDRTELDGQEIDILIGKLGIEINGVYWHSSLFLDKDYHQNKYLLARGKGIELLQFYDLEILGKWDIVTSMISSKLGIIPRRIPARKTTVRELTTAEYKSFMEANHLQGGINSGIRYGLVHGGELVAAVGVTLRRGVLVLDRFATRTHTQVVGGFSKLLSQLPRGVLRTHSANRYSSGAVYGKHGFSRVSEYPYTLAFTDFKEIYSREKFQKSRLTKMPGYDKSKTAEEILEENKIYALYAAGTTTWEIVLT